MGNHEIHMTKEETFAEVVKRIGFGPGRLISLANAKFQTSHNNDPFLVLEYNPESYSVTLCSLLSGEVIMHLSVANILYELCDGDYELRKMLVQYTYDRGYDVGNARNPPKGLFWSFLQLDR